MFSTCVLKQKVLYFQTILYSLSWKFQKPKPDFLGTWPTITRVFLNEFIYRAIEGHASLLFAHKTDIRKIDLDRHNSMVSIVNDTRSSCAIDYNFRTGMIYWSDVMTQKIYK